MPSSFLALLIPTLVAAQLWAKGAAVPDSDHQAKQFILSPDRKVYNIGINFAYQTTVLFPVDCSRAAVGDPEYFKVYFDERKKTRRFILSAEVDKPGASTAVTFFCDEGVDQVMTVTQVKKKEAVLLVEFKFDQQDTARVRTAVAAERERCVEEKEETLADARLKFQDEAERVLAEGLIKRLVFGDEFVATKSDGFINVKSRNAVLIGDRGYILFEVQPRADKPAVVDRIEVLEAETESVLPDVRLVMPERKVGPNNTSKAVAVFTNPLEAREFTLVVHLDGGETIELRGIEL